MTTGTQSILSHRDDHLDGGCAAIRIIPSTSRPKPARKRVEISREDYDEIKSLARKNDMTFSQAIDFIITVGIEGGFTD